MFENLEDKFAEVFKKVRGHGTLTEANVKDALRDVRLSLLEADVHFQVVKQFVNSVKERSLGQEVTASLSPGQEFIRIVSEELTQVMGGKAAKATGTKGAPKYAHPENPEMTWTGRGRQPNWVKEALASGKALEDMAI